MTDHRMEKSLELDATPEQVWEAIATGPGIGAWFVPHEVEPQVGGAVRGDFGGGFDGTGVVTGWEPGRRFAYGTPIDENRSYAFEFLVEARDGGGTVLRFVQSGFEGEGWEDEYTGFEGGWDLFFLNLRAYLEHFAGRRARNVVALVYTQGPATRIWPVLLRGLGLDAMPTEGDTVTFAPAEAPAVTGVVDVVTDKFLGIRSEAGLHRIGAEGDEGCGVSAYHYFYDNPPVDAGELTAAWQSWLARLFPAPVAV